MKFRRKKSKQGESAWRSRYGNQTKYKKMCKIAHQETYNICCVCLTRKSTQIHHAYYGKDIIGESIFPVCVSCHFSICHHKTNWIRCPEDPVWKNKNTEEFIQRLQLGYKSLVSQKAQIFELRKKFVSHCQIILIRTRMVLTLEETAIASGLSTKFLRKQIKLGNLNARKIGRKWMARPSDVDSLLDTLSISPPLLMDTDSIQRYLQICSYTEKLISIAFLKSCNTAQDFSLKNAASY